ncbi:MAG TPA: TIGR03862 family flavoprotein [Rudaea sp.]|nr:TIGR03862 family flavoprotein [Rudaea sp.]HSC11612.1 TIGR03862 family flavoprotein [Rhodanobacteraceae bacterium]
MSGNVGESGDKSTVDTSAAGAAHADARRVVVIGGGPAGLMAAEVARAAGAEVQLYDRLASAGRKFLIAGKGGLNLTHSESADAFAARYGARQDEVGRWLAQFGANEIREWARGLGVETFVGTSGRVFPTDLKAAPLLRTWVRRLRAGGVGFHMQHRWLGWCDDGDLRFVHPDGERHVFADTVVLALGGGSWPVLGSDASWVPLLDERGVAIAPLQPANCGFDIGWSEHFAARHAGHPLKPVVVEWTDSDGQVVRQQGEFVITATGVEGSLIYALSARLRDAIAARGATEIRLDLAPGRDMRRLVLDLAKPRGSRTLSEHWRRHAGIEGVKAGLLYEVLPKDQLPDPERVAATLKALPLTLTRPRPLDEAISSAGGVRMEALDDNLMIKCLPGVFCAGEMLDWEAPTGGYLLTACLASGRIAGAAAAQAPITQATRN